MKQPIPDTPARLHGSFNYGITQLSAEEVVGEFLRRVEITPDQPEKTMQAQRVIGALMALTALAAPGAGSGFFHKDVFRRLAELTGETPTNLVTMAGTAL